jgi:hypothetical protein
MYIDLTYKNSDLTLITLLSLTVICIFCANRDVSNKKKNRSEFRKKSMIVVRNIIDFSFLQRS